jgi:hypothetical protein
MASISACGPAETETTTSTTTGTTDLSSQSIIVDPGFTLSSTKQIDVEVVLSSHPNSPAYLSICHEKQHNDLPEIDYENCILRSPVKSGYFYGSFKLPGHQVNLQAAIWHYDLSIPPVIQAISPDTLQSGSIKMNL